MLERFTPEARGTIARAAADVSGPPRRLVDTEHILLALLSKDTGIASKVLSEAGLTAEGVRSDIERLTVPPEPILTGDDAAALRAIGIDVEAVLARIEESFGPGALEADQDDSRQATKRGFLGHRSGQPSGRVRRFTDRGRKVLELSLREAVRLHHDHIGTEHLLLGLIRLDDGLAMKILTDAGASPEGLRAAVSDALKAA